LDNWIFEYNRIEDKDFKPFFNMLLNLFREYFGDDIMSKENCTLQNFVDDNYPRLSCDGNKLFIKTTVGLIDSPLQSGCQYDYRMYVFQMAHELMHYAIMQQFAEGSCVDWFEETLCEAMAFIGLEYTMNKYFSRRPIVTRETRENLKSYLEKAMTEDQHSVLESCSTLETLSEINRHYAQGDNRSAQTKERIFIYSLLSEHSQQARILLNYRQYVEPNKLLIDFDKWIRDCPDGIAFLNEVRTIQPIISGAS